VKTKRVTAGIGRLITGGIDVSTEENVQLIRRFFAEIDRANLDGLDGICTDDYGVQFPGVPGPLDRAGAKHLFGAFVAAFPGISHGIEETVAEGDKVATRLTVRGTHRGEFQGIPPTGKDITITALNIFRIAGGRIASHWIEYDAVGMLQQLGVMPAPGGAGA
jgi:steroid delta-isomerase-like uncharacterized protein